MAWSFEIRSTTQALRDEIQAIVERRSRLMRRPIHDIFRDPDIQALRRRDKVRRLSYVGKPNRYRALQAQQFLHRRPGESLSNGGFEVEFDRNGLIFGRMDGIVVHNSKALLAYHPHSGGLGPIDSFARKIYGKRVGGLTIYSYKDKLTQEELDSFYVWYEKVFRRKLRRPRGRALDMKELPDDLDPLGAERA